MAKPPTRLLRLTLTDFRSYERADLVLDGRPVFLFGPNGAGKTNLLEAISLLFPGRGLRNASIAEVGRRQPGEAQGRAWSVAAAIEGEDEPVRLGAGTESPGATRRGWCSPPNPSIPPTRRPLTAPSASACGCLSTAPMIRPG